MHYAAIKEAAKVENVRYRGVKLSLTAVRQNPLHNKTLWEKIREHLLLLFVL